MDLIKAFCMKVLLSYLAPICIITACNINFRVYCLLQMQKYEKLLWPQIGKQFAVTWIGLY